MKKILFIASHRQGRAPGQRFRFEQYFDFLSQQGFECKLSSLISEKDDAMLYSHGNYLNKFLFLLKCYKRRWQDILHINQFDIVFIFREALMSRSTFFERGLSRLSKGRTGLIFDFDDAIWLQNVSNANKNFVWLKNPGKTSKLIGLSDMIFAGNRYLADYALQFNANVKVIPTTIDTNEYVNEKKIENEKVCIGWSGSITTIQHFEYAIPFLKIIKERYGDKVYFKVIGDKHYQHDGLGVQGIDWNKEDEIKEFSEMDIGIMPLPDDEWAKGKCGLKGLQYMALEIPTVMSPVGVNTEIIQDGENGFLADSNEEWVEKLSALIESKELREKLGRAARETVINKYSVESNKHKYFGYFNEILVQ